MLIFEARHQIQERIRVGQDYKENIPEYLEALEIADKALRAQELLSIMLNDFYAEDEEQHKNDRYSRALTLELLESVRWDYHESEEEE